MNSAGKPQLVRNAVKRSLKALWAGLVSVFFCLLVIAFWGANISSCVSDGNPGGKGGKKLSIVELDRKNTHHTRIERSLDSVWLSATGAEQRPKVFIADSREINAASFGSGRFLVWDGVADLPDSVISAIFAHEVAHDILRHSKKAQDVKDVTDFFGDVLSVFGGADAGTERTMKRWVGYTAIPKYSRSQEFEADAKAVEILRMLGSREPEREFADALQLLLAKYGNLGGGFFDNHPSTTERIKRLRSDAPGRAAGAGP